MEERVNYCQVVNYVSIEENLYNRLNKLGMIPNETRKTNVGNSNYAKHLTQPWSIWIDYNLNAWDADIVKRDENDSNREVAPAIPADDAIFLDNSELTREETVEAAMNIIAEKLKRKR